MRIAHDFASTKSEFKHGFAMFEAAWAEPSMGIAKVMGPLVEAIERGIAKDRELIAASASAVAQAATYTGGRVQS